MANYKTPGVYIVENSTISGSISAVDSAVPAFVGYTQKAPALNTPYLIRSFNEFVDNFGGAPQTTFAFADGAVGAATAQNFLLYRSMQLFYANGGGECYIVSVGYYRDNDDASEQALTNGIEALKKEMNATMLVCPDAMVSDGTSNVHTAMLQHCGGDMRNRFAILDVPKDSTIEDFRDTVTQYLNYGAAYYPWLNTNIVSGKEVSYDNIDAGSKGHFQTYLKAQNKKENSDENGNLTAKGRYIEAVIAEVCEDIGQDSNVKAKLDRHNKLYAQLKAYYDVMKDIREQLNTLPPSGAMAGVYTYIDNTVNVAKAPANIGLSSVLSPTVTISKEDQEDLNIPSSGSGKAINAIRAFKGKGTLVWGARTLDGNSGDWRYIGVRRSMIMIEESIRRALEGYVFAPNNQATWLDINSQITAFLTKMWNQGILMGNKQDEAFQVAIGLGSTMTPQDVIDGYLRISVKLCIVRPAEFIEVTFEQMMPSA